MASKRNTLQFINILAWTLFFVVISGAQNSGEVPNQRMALDLELNITNSSEVNGSDTTTASHVETTEISTLITKLTSLQQNPITVIVDVGTPTKELSSTTLSVETTTPSVETTTLSARTTTLSAETTTLSAETTTRPLTESTAKIMSEVLATLNGYKIATFCLAAILGIILFIILIYFSAKSKTGHGEITDPPGTPPQDVEDYTKQEEPQVVRLSSYFPYAVDTLPKDDINENGVVDDRKVTTFLTKKNKPPEDATGSRDKILYTSEL